MDGILLVDKPLGWTSFDVVAKVRSTQRIAKSQELLASSKKVLAKDYQPSASLRKLKVGHTGTLDPLATGLLVLVVGNYTKRAQEFSKLDKTYQVSMKLGATSSTGDSEGIITTYHNSPLSHRIVIGEEEITEVMEGFVGDIKQVPPAFSAIKVNGQRAYKLARAGKEVKLEPRKVIIHDISNIKFAPPIVQNLTIVQKSTMGLWGEVRFTARVSSGTYIRSLVEDIGEKLGTGAYITALRRTEVGRFLLKDAQKIDDKDILKYIFTVSKETPWKYLEII